MQPVTLIVASIILIELSISVIVTCGINTADIGSERVNPHMTWQYHSRSRTLCEMLLYHVGTESIQTGREIVGLSAVLCTDYHHTVLLLHRFTLHAHGAC